MGLSALILPLAAGLNGPGAPVEGPDGWHGPFFGLDFFSLTMALSGPRLALLERL